MVAIVPSQAAMIAGVIPAGTAIDTTGDHSAVRNREWRFLVNGELRDAVNGSTFERISSFTREVIATVPSGDADDELLSYTELKTINIAF